jgi:hypothetical protein
MNLEQLKKNVGFRMKLVPPAQHLDNLNDPKPVVDEDWIVEAVTDEFISLKSVGLSHVALLGKDHVKNFATDPNRATDGLDHGFLILLVQVFINGTKLWTIPTPMPGMPVPPPSNLEFRARAIFAPEAERLLRRLIGLLDRVLVNYRETSRGQPASPGDSWPTLKPFKPTVFPAAPQLKDLSAADVAKLSDFCAASQEVDDVVDAFISARQFPEYNAWNFLMHRLELGVQAGRQVVASLNPTAQFDAASPASGTMLEQAARVLTGAEQARADFIARASKRW